MDGDFAFGVVRALFEPAGPEQPALLSVGPARLAAPVVTLVEEPSGHAVITAARLHGLYWLTVGLADGGPLILVVDDVHWADEPFQIAFTRDLTPGERAAVVDGTEGRRRHQVYLRWAPDRRNAVWEADHKELPVLVMAPRAQQPRKPWVTLFVEAYSRLIMGWALSLYPNAAVVLAALRRGIVVDSERGPFGGLPEKLVPDNGLEFAATALRRSRAGRPYRSPRAPAPPRCGTAPSPMRPRSPRPPASPGTRLHDHVTAKISVAYCQTYPSLAAAT